MTVLYLAASRLKELTLSLRVSTLDVALWLAVTVLLLMGVNVAAQIAEKVIETTAEMVETSVAALNAESPPRVAPETDWRIRECSDPLSTSPSCPFPHQSNSKIKESSE